MESKAKKRLMNLIMVLLILVIAVSGIVTVGMFRGWFDRTEESVFVSGNIKGSANIERKGIGYSLDSNMPLQGGDIIETKKGAEVQLIWQAEKEFKLNGNSEITIETDSSEKAVIKADEGELFADVSADEEKLLMKFNDNESDLSGAVFSVSVQSGSSTLNLYAGDISVTLEDGTRERVEAGEYLSVVDNSDGTVSYQIEDMQPVSLSEFLITELQNCRSPEDLCFAAADLQKVLDDRVAEKQAALEASLKAQTIADTEEKKDSEKAETEKNDAGQDPENEETAETGETEQPAEESSVASEETTQDKNICTITILCDTILNNMDDLDDGKEAYVPANGTILATSSVEFEEGETVFDVLTRVCEYAGIQIEYSWTAIYNSYYIEGINNLYEFDCGNESGWMYKVNGWFPNYGCSSYELEDGDNIVWCYTCNGLGADVGGPTY